MAITITTVTAINITATINSLTLYKNLRNNGGFFVSLCYAFQLAALITITQSTMVFTWPAFTLSTVACDNPK